MKLIELLTPNLTVRKQDRRGQKKKMSYPLGTRVRTLVSGPEVGTVMFTGPVAGMGSGTFIGIAFSKPVPHGMDGAPLFPCGPKCGLLVAPNTVSLAMNSSTAARYEFPYSSAAYHGMWKTIGGETLAFHGKGAFTSHEVQYDGHYIDGAKHGHGSLQGDGLRYEGQWEQNVPHGEGTLTISRLGVYTGTFTEGSLRKGTAEYVQGSTYSGAWLKGAKDGQGTFTQRSGKVTYEGTWQDGQPHGRGILTSGAHTIRGTFLGGVPHGTAIHTITRESDGTMGERYEGDFSEGKRCGRGTLTTDMFEYEGDFVHNVRHGRGQCNWYKHGVSYDGNWENDKPHGFGTLRLLAGVSLECNFEEGNLTGDNTVLKVSADGQTRQRVRVNFTVP